MVQDATTSSCWLVEIVLAILSLSGAVAHATDSPAQLANSGAFTMDGRRLLMTVPPYQARIGQDFLLPREVVARDAHSI